MSRSLAELDTYLAGHWKFENNFLDSSPNNNDGTPTAIEWKPTARGLKPKFNGTAYIDPGSDIDYPSGADNRSVSAWVFVNSFDNDAVLEYGTYSTNNRFGVNVGGIGSNGYLRLSTHVNNFNAVDTFSVGEWHFVTFVIEDNTWFPYLDGVLDSGGSVPIPEINTIHSGDMKIGMNQDGTHKCNATYDDIRIYSTAFDADEVLALYNSTKLGHGVLRHESSFTHRLTPPEDKNAVASFDMHTKNADRTLIDLSGNSNHGTVVGAVRSGGYFADGMRFDGVDDYVNTGLNDSFDEITLEVICKQSTVEIANIFGRNLSGSNDGDVLIYNQLDKFAFQVWSAAYEAEMDSTVIADRYYHLVGTCSISDGIRLYVDGELQSDVAGYKSPSVSPTEPFAIGAWLLSTTPSGYMDGEVVYASINGNPLSDSAIKSRFNALAVLPLYEIDFSRYPSNDTVYADNIPYSSMRVESGSFKIDGSQLVCVTDGIIKMRNAHDFDESEYITIIIDGVEYSGTGTVTQGTVTASIEQGSNLISIDMDAADTLDKVNIQFREPVE